MEKKLSDVILFTIDQTTKTAKQYSQREFDRAGLGITVEQWVLLKIIEENKSTSQADLAEKSLRDPASITRTLDILQTKGFVTREIVANNRRQYNIVLTEAGLDFVASNMAMIDDHRTRSIQGFSEDELTMLQAFLLRVQHNMQ